MVRSSRSKRKLNRSTSSKKKLKSQSRSKRRSRYHKPKFRNVCKVDIRESSKPEKKLMAVFSKCKYSTKGGLRKINSKTVHFGARGMSDYTIHKDKARRDRYDIRHRKREHWDDPFTPGALSKLILWGNHTDRRKAIRAFKRKFNFK